MNILNLNYTYWYVFVRMHFNIIIQMNSEIKSKKVKNNTNDTNDI